MIHLYRFCNYVGYLIRIVTPERLFVLFFGAFQKIYAGYKCAHFKYFKDAYMEYPATEIVGDKYISVGEETSLGRYIVLTAWDQFGGITYTPKISIGRNVNIGEYAHITAVNSIIIEDNVLFGKHVLITDNAHGASRINEMLDPPTSRIVYSPGPVHIKRNVWIGDKVSIMPNVTIGEGSIVAANAVVTKDVPPYSVVAGVPAKIMKRFK